MCSASRPIRIGLEARGGKDPLTFIGLMRGREPARRILHRPPESVEELALVDIDPAEARIKALNAYNDLLRDRRPSLYEA